MAARWGAKENTPSPSSKRTPAGRLTPSRTHIACGRMDEERVEVEFGDMVGVVDGKTRVIGSRMGSVWRYWPMNLAVPGGVASMAERRLGNRGLRSASWLILAQSPTTAMENEIMSC